MRQQVDIPVDRLESEDQGRQRQELSADTVAYPQTVRAITGSFTG